MEDIVSNFLIPTSSRDYISQYLNDFFSSVQKDKDPPSHLLLKNANRDSSIHSLQNLVVQFREQHIRITNFHDTVDFVDNLHLMIRDFVAGLFPDHQTLRFRIETETLKMDDMKRGFVAAELTPSHQVTYFVDTSLGVDTYLELLKPAVRRDIRRSFENFQFSPVSNYSQFMYNYSYLHGEMSGSQISRNSWLVLLDSLKNNCAMAVEATYKGQFVGGAIFSIGDKTAHYTNGAFDRRLYPLPITHGLLISAFRELYDSGQKLIVLDDYFSDQIDDEKKVNIRNFKINFSNKTFERQIYQFRIDSKA